MKFGIFFKKKNFIKYFLKYFFFSTKFCFKIFPKKFLNIKNQKNIYFLLKIESKKIAKAQRRKGKIITINIKNDFSFSVEKWTKQIGQGHWKFIWITWGSRDLIGSKELVVDQGILLLGVIVGLGEWGYSIHIWRIGGTMKNWISVVRDIFGVFHWWPIEKMTEASIKRTAHRLWHCSCYGIWYELFLFY